MGSRQLVVSRKKRWYKGLAGKTAKIILREKWVQNQTVFPKMACSIKEPSENVQGSVKTTFYLEENI